MAIRSPSHVPNTYLLRKEVRIATPVCTLARDLSRIILSQCPLIAFFSISHKVLSQKQLVEISFL